MNTLLSMVLHQTANKDQCHFPDPAASFSQSAIMGTWYEVAKFQTAGGAYFEKDCVCTELDYFSDKSTFEVDNICRDKTPQGKTTSAVATLTPEGKNGHFKESFSPLAPSVDYTIILLGEYKGEHYSVEYDCSSNFTGTNYCIHFMSR